MTPQYIKDRLPKSSDLVEGYSYDTSESCASIELGRFDTDNTVRVTIDNNWMGAEDLLEAAALFKKLAKKLQRGGF